MNTAIERLETMGLVTDSENGAKVIDLEKYKLAKAVVKKKGTSPRFIVFHVAYLSFALRWNYSLSYS